MPLTNHNTHPNGCALRYYVAPVCFAFLLAPLLALEAPKLLQSASAWGRVGPGLLLLSAAAAFALNLSVLLLIGKTSALVRASG